MRTAAALLDRLDNIVAVTGLARDGVEHQIADDAAVGARGWAAEEFGEVGATSVTVGAPPEGAARPKAQGESCMNRSPLTGREDRVTTHRVDVSYRYIWI